MYSNGNITSDHTEVPGEMGPWQNMYVKSRVGYKSPQKWFLVAEPGKKHIGA